MEEKPVVCERLVPVAYQWIIPVILGVVLVLIGVITQYIGFVGYIGIIIALMLSMSISSLDKCWDFERAFWHFLPYAVFSAVLIALVILTGLPSLRLLGLTETEITQTSFDLTYGFQTFWVQLAAAVVTGGAPTINFVASIVMYGVAAFMLIYGDRMENAIVMLGGTLMLFAPMILAFTAVLITGVPVGFFSEFAAGFELFGPAGRIVMAIVCIVPDALIISVLMTIERLIPEPVGEGVPEA